MVIAFVMGDGME